MTQNDGGMYEWMNEVKMNERGNDERLNGAI